jgi:hypothetical protein
VTSGRAAAVQPSSVFAALGRTSCWATSVSTLPGKYLRPVFSLFMLCFRCGGPARCVSDCRALNLDGQLRASMLKLVFGRKRYLAAAAQSHRQQAEDGQQHADFDLYDGPVSVTMRDVRTMIKGLCLDYAPLHNRLCSINEAALHPFASPVKVQVHRSLSESRSARFTIWIIIEGGLFQRHTCRSLDGHNANPPFRAWGSPIFQRRHPVHDWIWI